MYSSKIVSYSWYDNPVFPDTERAQKSPNILKVSLSNVTDMYVRLGDPMITYNVEDDVISIN